MEQVGEAMVGMLVSACKDGDAIFVLTERASCTACEYYNLGRFYPLAKSGPTVSIRIPCRPPTSRPS